jgi:dGTPase
MLDWESLMCARRRKDGHKPGRGFGGARTEHERDYDRILFVPIRRSDKAQVFPLDRDDSVHTRLTHSHEVSNLARSIGVNLAFNHEIFPASVHPQRNVPAMLAAVGLVHDVGNPPFGHRGETSIQDWFKARQQEIFPQDCGLTDGMRHDFLKFEGNAQTLRLLTRLQILNDDFGLNVTYGLYRIIVHHGSWQRTRDRRAGHENLDSSSERRIVEDVWRNTG